MGLLRMGFVTRFLSHPVLSGFTSAAALIIGFGQLKHVVGFAPRKSDNLFLVIADVIARLGSEAHWPSIVMGIAVIVFMQLFKNITHLKKLPAAMIVVALSIIVSWALDLGNTHGFQITGAVPAGIPSPVLAQLPSRQELGQLITLVLVSTMIGYMESVAVAIVYAGRNGYKIEPDQELVAMGLANIAGSFFSCFQTAGGFGRTAVNAGAGSKTPLAGFISGILPPEVTRPNALHCTLQPCCETQLLPPHPPLCIPHPASVIYRDPSVADPTPSTPRPEVQALKV